MPSEFTPDYGWRTRAASLLVGCLLWESVAVFSATPFLPSCTGTLLALFELARERVMFASLAVSLVNLATGFVGAAVVGVAAGVAMARVRRIGWLAAPYLHALLAAPGIIYVPLLFTVFGATRATQVGSVFLHAVFVIIATTAGALETRDRTLTAMASAFGATEPQVFWRVRWPAALPLVMSGLRIGVLLAVKGMLNGEMFIAFTGLGALVRGYGARFEPDKVLALVIVIAGVALVSTAIIDSVGRRVQWVKA